MKNKKSDKIKKIKGIRRDLMVELGLYDGRFKTKIIVDKKKKQNKEICRIKIF